MSKCFGIQLARLKGLNEFDIFGREFVFHSTPSGAQGSELQVDIIRAGLSILLTP